MTPAATNTQAPSAEVEAADHDFPPRGDGSSRNQERDVLEHRHGEEDTGMPRGRTSRRRVDGGEAGGDGGDEVDELEIDEFTVLKQAVTGTAAPSSHTNGRATDRHGNRVIDPSALEKGLGEKQTLPPQHHAPPVTEISGDQERRTIGKRRPKAVVRVERDYTAGGATSGRVQFYDGWIDELEGRISPLQFQNTLNELNAILASAYDPYKSIFDNTLAVLTLYLSPRILGTHYRRQMRRLAEIIERENRQVYNPAGLNIMHPRKVAFFFLEIEQY